MSEPFARARAMMDAIAAIMAINNKVEQQTALGALGTYRSRGKGRGSVNHVYGNQAGKYMPHQGAREMARRVRQGAPKP